MEGIGSVIVVGHDSCTLGTSYFTSPCGWQHVARIVGTHGNNAIVFPDSQ